MVYNLILLFLIIMLYQSNVVISFTHLSRGLSRRLTTSMSSLENDKLAAMKGAIPIGINGIIRHIFLCADQQKPKCCSLAAGLESWDFLKERLKELKLVGPKALIGRTKANCLQVTHGSYRMSCYDIY